MKTTIDNNQRVFLLTNDENSKVFCNLQDIESAHKELSRGMGKPVYYQHFWNDKVKVASKKLLRAMLEADNLNISFLN